ncbi:MAG: trypsin, partial [Acidobacteriota bacterium]
MAKKSNHRRFRNVLLTLAILCCTAFPQVKQESDNNNTDKTLSPYFLVTGDPNVDQLPLKDTSVEISVSGVIADIRVVQTYQNEGTRPIHATYVFPAS